MTSITGLYINLLYPKLNWESEQEVVKQGISVLVTMSVNFIIVVIPMVLYFILSLNEIFKLSIVAMSYIVFIILCAILLFKQGKNYTKNYNHFKIIDNFIYYFLFKTEKRYFLRMYIGERRS